MIKQDEFPLKTKNKCKREQLQANQMQEEIFIIAVLLAEWTTSSPWLVNNRQIRQLINHKVQIYITQLIIIIGITIHWRVVHRLWGLAETKVKENLLCPLRMDRKSQMLRLFITLPLQMSVKNFKWDKFHSLPLFKIRKLQTKNLESWNLSLLTLMLVLSGKRMRIGLQSYWTWFNLKPKLLKSMKVNGLKFKFSQFMMGTVETNAQNIWKSIFTTK